MAGLLPVAQWLGRPLVVAEAIQPVDSIVVLGAGIYDDTTLTPDSAYRLLRGVQLLKAGHAQQLLLTGGSHRGTRTSDARVMAGVAATLGVDPSAMVVDEVPVTTWQQAQSVARIARARGIRSIALVTSPLHSYRASQAFRRSGLQVVSAPAGPALDPRLLTVGEDHPAGRLELAIRALYEHVAIVAYRWRGRL